MVNPSLIWINVLMAETAILFFFFIVVRGVPLQMGLARLRRRTVVIEDKDTCYEVLPVRQEGAGMVITKDGRAWGKAFRLKLLNGIRIGFAVPDDFIMTDPTMARAVEEDNKNINDPENYKKMEDSDTMIKVNGEFARLGEITKGLTKKRSPLLIKAAMAQAEQEGRESAQRDPTKTGGMIFMVCLGLGILLVLMSKAGVFG
jgi:hypothetical protein